MPQLGPRIAPLKDLSTYIFAHHDLRLDFHMLAANEALRIQRRRREILQEMKRNSGCFVRKNILFWPFVCGYFENLAAQLPHLQKL